MRPTILLPTMAALLAVPTTASAFELAGDEWSLSFEPRIQSRIELASASDENGDDYDIWERSTTENPQAANFYLRRARLYMKGKHQDGWKFNITLSADNLGRGGDADGADPTVRYMWVGKDFKAEDMKHSVSFGLDKHSSSLDMWDSSSKYLLPNAKLVEQYGGPRSVGINYKLATPIFTIGAGIADEAEGLTFDGTDVDAGSNNNDWLFYARVETGLKEEWTLAKRSESYLGKEGFGHLAGLGFDIKTDGSDEAGAGTEAGLEDDDRMTINLDYLIHYNQITALFALAQTSFGDAYGDDLSALGLVLQAGYAFPQDNGEVFEVAARISLIDNDMDEDEEQGVLDREGGDSGTYVDLGVNYYLDGHSNKFQAGVQIYSPEEGDGSATVFRLAHQLDF